MQAVWILIVLFVLLYPAAFISGLVRGKLGPRGRPFGKLVSIVTYLALALVAVPMVT